MEKSHGTNRSDRSGNVDLELVGVGGRPADQHRDEGVSRIVFPLSLREQAIIAFAPYALAVLASATISALIVVSAL